MEFLILQEENVLHQKGIPNLDEGPPNLEKEKESCMNIFNIQNSKHTK